MVIFFCLYYYVITVTHPKILTTSQTPQGQPKGPAHVEGGASSTSQRGHTGTCCTPHLSHAECWRGKRCSKTWYGNFQTLPPSQQQNLQ